MNRQEAIAKLNEWATKATDSLASDLLAIRDMLEVPGDEEAAGAISDCYDCADVLSGYLEKDCADDLRNIANLIESLASRVRELEAETERLAREKRELEAQNDKKG